MMECKFEIGQKVVCTPYWGGNIDNREIYSYLKWPQPNEVYTIRDMVMGNFPDVGGEGIGLGLVEIPDQYLPTNGSTVRWDYREFQPLTYLDTDISIFTKMLTTKKLEEA